MTDYRSIFYKRILFQSFYFEISYLIKCVTVMEGDSHRRLETTVDVYVWQQRQYGEWQVSKRSKVQFTGYLGFVTRFLALTGVRGITGSWMDGSAHLTVVCYGVGHSETKEGPDVGADHRR